MSTPPLSNYPRPEPPKETGHLTRAERYAGCGCVFVPAGLLLFAATGGLLLGETVLPDGSVGWEPGRGIKILVALGGAALCVGLGCGWLGGRPRTRSAGVRLLVGVAVFAGAMLARLMEGFPFGVILAGLALVLIVSAFVRDGTTDRSG